MWKLLIFSWKIYGLSKKFHLKPNKESFICKLATYVENQNYNVLHTKTAVTLCDQWNTQIAWPNFWTISHRLKLKNCHKLSHQINHKLAKSQSPINNHWKAVVSILSTHLQQPHLSIICKLNFFFPKDVAQIILKEFP